MDNGGTFTIEMTANESVVFLVGALAKGTYDITWTCEASQGGSGDEEPEEPEVVVKDVNGIGGEYSITYIMPDAIVLTFTPTAAGATTGTLNVVDNLGNPATNITYTYEYVDGAYVFYLNDVVTSDVMVTNDTQSWTFQNASLRMPQAFAQVATEEEEQEPSSVLAVGDNVINVTEANLEAGEFTMEFTAASAGNYKFSSGSLYVSAITPVGSDALTQNDDYTYTLQEGVTYTLTFNTFLISAAGNQDLNISIVAEEEEEVLTILTTGENTITVTETDITNEFISAQFFVMEAGDYTFDSDISVIIYDDYANYIEPNQDGSYTLEAYLNCSITLSTVGLTAGEYEMNITFVAAEEEEEIVSIPELVEGNNEFTVTETDILNEFITVEFLALEAGNYTFAGEINMNVCDANANYIEPNQDGSYTFTAETTYTITLFTSGLEAGVYSINVSKA